MKIIGVDPGKNTGLCVITRVGDALAFELRSGDPFFIVSYVHDIAAVVNEKCVVAAERWIAISHKHSPQYDALETIGALRYVCGINGTPFELSSRADRKRVTKEIITQVTDVRPTDDDQESALQHAILTAVKHRVIDPRVLVGKM